MLLEYSCCVCQCIVRSGHRNMRKFGETSGIIRAMTFDVTLSSGSIIRQNLPDGNTLVTNHMATACEDECTRIFAWSMAAARTCGRSSLGFLWLSKARGLTMLRQVTMLFVSIHECPGFQDLNTFRAGSVLFEARIRWCQSLSCQHQCSFETLS
jgi:hypothetical protein